jgi:hypothetical protein
MDGGKSGTRRLQRREMDKWTGKSKAKTTKHRKEIETEAGIRREGKMNGETVWGQNKEEDIILRKEESQKLQEIDEQRR